MTVDQKQNGTCLTKGEVQVQVTYNKLFRENNLFRKTTRGSEPGGCFLFKPLKQLIYPETRT
jgi:hypothetical protein